jgi:hypothetical protein
VATYTKQKLSGSTNGKGIKVAATATPGTLLHTAVAGTSDWDEVWLYAMNSDSSDRALTIEWGGVADPDDLIEVTIPGQQGLVLVAPGLVLQNELVVRAFAAAADVVTIHGFVNRIAA